MTALDAIGFVAAGVFLSGPSAEPARSTRSAVHLEVGLQHEIEVSSDWRSFYMTLLAILCASACAAAVWLAVRWLLAVSDAIRDTEPAA